MSKSRDVSTCKTSGVILFAWNSNVQSSEIRSAFFEINAAKHDGMVLFRSRWVLSCMSSNDRNKSSSG